MKTAAAVQRDQNRADYLEYLYELYERGNPSIEHHHCYTGLMEAHRQTAGEELVTAQVEGWHLMEATVRKETIGVAAAA